MTGFQEQRRAGAAGVGNPVAVRGAADEPAANDRNLLLALEQLESRSNDLEFQPEAARQLVAGQLAGEVQRLQSQLQDEVQGQPRRFERLGRCREWNDVRGFSDSDHWPSVKDDVRSPDCVGDAIQTLLPAVPEHLRPHLLRTLVRELECRPRFTGLVERLQRVAVIAGGKIDDAAVVERACGIAGIHELRAREIDAPCRRERERQVVAGGGHCRVELERLPACLDGRVEAPLDEREIAKIVDGVRRLRLEPACRLVGRTRVVMLAERLHDRAVCVPGRSRPWRIVDGAVRVAESESREAPVSPDPRQAVVRSAVARIQRDRAVEIPLRGVEDATLAIALRQVPVPFRGRLARGQKQRCSNRGIPRLQCLDRLVLAERPGIDAEMPNLLHVLGQRFGRGRGSVRCLGRRRRRLRGGRLPHRTPRQEYCRERYAARWLCERTATSLPGSPGCGGGPCRRRRERRGGEHDEVVVFIAFS